MKTDIYHADICQLLLERNNHADQCLQRTFKSCHAIYVRFPTLRSSDIVEVDAHSALQLQTSIKGTAHVCDCTDTVATHLIMRQTDL